MRYTIKQTGAILILPADIGTQCACKMTRATAATSEWLTRKRLIDAKLKDYVLCLDGRIAGVVEAKKLSLGPQNVLVQAERYAKGLAESPFDYRGYHAAFHYSTSGEQRQA